MKTKPELQLDYHCFASPLGWVLLAASPKGICLVHFCGTSALSPEEGEVLVKQAFPDAALSYRENPLLHEAEAAILKYLGERQPLPAFPLDVRSGAPFHHQAWKALCEIPFGQTRSYLQVAQALGKPRSARAVGQACAKNPVPLFIPCHRVIATSGKLGGFSSGLHIKEALLEIEAIPGST
jgi:O-6-methylguanine DNA methyltransferase